MESPVSPHSNTQHKHDCGAESPVSPHSNTQHKHDCGAESPLMVDQNPNNAIALSPEQKDYILAGEEGKS
ncbi:hypothetical protein RRG08_004086 [Elysia crispata]|uniref:Uncharacterized protein n=1 Tax=Elysia crispata TaxID=231223 RepID=A0AAE0XVK5_9GAST|nr:hypothetical protein RRG08_004086 [Elysia crispata]